MEEKKEQLIDFVKFSASLEKNDTRFAIGQNIKSKYDLMRDAATYSFATLAGAVTIASTAPALIKTMPLFIVGCVGLFLIIALSIWSRWELSNFEDDILFAIDRMYVKKTTAAFAFEFGQIDKEKFRVAVNEPFPALRPTKLLDRVIKIVLFSLLIALSFIALALTVTISIHF